MVTTALRAEGIVVHTGVKVTSVSATDGKITATLDNGETVTAHHLLVSTGRRARVADIGLERVGIDPGAHQVNVDEQMRAADGVWAVGDVTGRGAFTHMAMYQARLAIASILGKPAEPAQYHAVPRVTFTDPEVGSVGMSEATAREAGLPVKTGAAEVGSTARGWIHGPGNAGIIKLVENTATGTLVGATSVGPWGGEVLSLLALAVHAQTPVTTLAQMIYAYPTFHRGIEDAVRSLTG